MFAFHLGECVLVVSSPSLISDQTVAYVTSLDTDEETLGRLEDNKWTYKKLALSLSSVWVDEDIKTIRNDKGPFGIWATWTNEDDGRLRSEGLQNAALVNANQRGALEGVEIWQLRFEALSRT